MVSRQGELPSSIRVECPNCGFFSPVALSYAEGTTADYEAVCESELGAGGLCGAALLVTVTVPEDLAGMEGIGDGRY